MSELRNNYQWITGQSIILNRDCTVDGSLGGDGNMAVNGSVTSVEFWVQPLSTELFEVDYLSLAISDTGNPAENDYGGVAGPLPNGVVIFLERDGVKIDFSLPIKRNIQLIDLSTNFESFQLSSGRVLVYREIFTRYAKGIRLNGATGDKFGVRIQDDLSTLTHHGCQIKGKQFGAGS